MIPIILTQKGIEIESRKRIIRIKMNCLYYKICMMGQINRYKTMIANYLIVKKMKKWNSIKIIHLFNCRKQLQE